MPGCRSQSGEAIYRGWPPLSPVKDGSKARVRNPRSAMVWAYRPEHCSFTAPKGPQTAMAGSYLDDLIAYIEYRRDMILAMH